MLDSPDTPDISALLENYFRQCDCASEAAKAIVALSRYPVVCSVLLEYFQTRLDAENSYFDELKNAGVKSHLEAYELFKKNSSNQLD